MKSIMQDEKECYLCGSTRFLEEHHIFGGANRKWSEKYGLKVYLCHYCHNEPPNGVHFNQERNLYLKKQDNLNLQDITIKMMRNLDKFLVKII